MVIGPAKAGPICFSGSDGWSKAPHRRPAKNSVTGPTELVPEHSGDLISGEHVLPRLDRFVAGGRKVSLRRVMQIHVPAAAREAGPFGHERHRREIGIREGKKHAVLSPYVPRGAPLDIRARAQGVVGHEHFPSP